VQTKRTGRVAWTKSLLSLKEEIRNKLKLSVSKWRYSNEGEDRVAAALHEFGIDSDTVTFVGKEELPGYDVVDPLMHFDPVGTVINVGKVWDPTTPLVIMRYRTWAMTEGYRLLGHGEESRVDPAVLD
jgi:hypothetical protein